MKHATFERKRQTHLKIEMLRRDLSLRDLSRISGIHYVSVSGLLNGRIVQPENLRKIVDAIESVPVAEEAEITPPEEFHAQTRAERSAAAPTA